MRVLVACEFSGIVREAFAKRGHDAWSCDLLPTEILGNHFMGDIFDMLERMPDWDLMIAFPPCTDLAVSGAAWFEQKRKDGRQQRGIDFFMRLANLPIDKIAIENPVGIMSTVWRKPDQIIQPYQFGDSISKKTCLWLKGLPLLTPTRVVPRGERVTFASGRNMDKWYASLWRLPKTERAKQRSKTFPGIAEAFASQWSEAE